MEERRQPMASKDKQAQSSSPASSPNLGDSRRMSDLIELSRAPVVKLRQEGEFVVEDDGGASSTTPHYVSGGGGGGGSGRGGGGGSFTAHISRPPLLQCTEALREKVLSSGIYQFRSDCEEVDIAGRIQEMLKDKNVLRMVRKESDSISNDAPTQLQEQLGGVGHDKKWEKVNNSSLNTDIGSRIGPGSGQQQNGRRTMIAFDRLVERSVSFVCVSTRRSFPISDTTFDSAHRARRACVPSSRQCMRTWGVASQGFHSISRRCLLAKRRPEVLATKV